MNRRMTYCAVLTGFAIAGLPGCMPKMTMEDMKQMRPERPVELDRLNMFEGRWEGTGEAKVAGLDEPLKTKGSSESHWECDGWYLVEHGEHEMGEMGKMKGIGIWTWDPKRKKYRTWWFDDWGTNGTGTATYNESTRTWCFKAKGNSPMGSTVGRGCIKMVDDNTMKWCYAEWPGWDLFRVFKIMEMKGTYKRK